ncbi:hypothetical protein C447_12275 [Halococcus hamelinensis 100A6]|uniref:Uncharacterized protein n=1 Tax=Halococcus hamelinensis 100A6 TaxID=1132509 RepID=M0LZF1_9EURY|nr:hypothetical protein C447_12275 [Halococcus hamelinensis 100A6]
MRDKTLKCESSILAVSDMSVVVAECFIVMSVVVAQDFALLRVVVLEAIEPPARIACIENREHLDAPTRDSPIELEWS